MIRYQILRNLWAVVSFFTGLALVLFVVLTYFDIWRPRHSGKEDPEKSERPLLTIWKTFPWSLKISYFILIIWGIAYGIYLVFYPPNW